MIPTVTGILPKSRTMQFSRNYYQTGRKGWKVTSCILPSSVVELIENHFTDPNEGHRAIHAVNILFHKALNRGLLPDEYILVADEYKGYLFNGNRNYFKIINRDLREKLTLLEPQKLSKGVIYCEGEAIRYRFNPKYVIDQEYVTVYYEQRTGTSERKYTKTKDLTSLNDAKDVFIEYRIQDILHRITLTLTEAEIEPVVRSRKGEIAEKIRRNSWQEKTGTIKYRKDNKIHTFKKGLYRDLEHFIRDRTEITIQQHISSLNRLLPGTERTLPHRDKWGKRLYHDVVNVAKPYLKYLRLGGEPLFEIDLRNSQFCILANILLRTSISNPTKPYSSIAETLLQAIDTDSRAGKPGKEEKEEGETNNAGAYLSSHFSIDKVVLFDKNSGRVEEIKRFIEASLNGPNGSLYDFITGKLYDKDLINNELIEEVKSLMFQMLFCDLRYDKSSGDKKRLWKKLPESMRLISGIKAELAARLLTFESQSDSTFDIRQPVIEHMKDPDKAGSNLFCLGLQRIESIIFIDEILRLLLLAGLDVLSKHDSFLCKESEKEKVYEIVYRELLRILGSSAAGVPNFSLRLPRSV